MSRGELGYPSPVAVKRWRSAKQESVAAFSLDRAKCCLKLGGCSDAHGDKSESQCLCGRCGSFNRARSEVPDADGSRSGVLEQLELLVPDFRAGREHHSGDRTAWPGEAVDEPLLEQDIEISVACEDDRHGVASLLDDPRGHR